MVISVENRLGNQEWTPGLLQLRSSQPYSVACQAYHIPGHVRTTLGNSRCNLTVGQAAARRINTARMAPRLARLRYHKQGTGNGQGVGESDTPPDIPDLSMDVLSPLSLKYLCDPTE
jgi:hypothetical protein